MVAPLIAAAGLTAGAGLLQNLMAQEQQKQAAAEAAYQARLKHAQDRMAMADQNELNSIQSRGQGEQSAINNLLAALMRTAR